MKRAVVVLPIVVIVAISEIAAIVVITAIKCGCGVVLGAVLGLVWGVLALWYGS